MMTMIKPQIAVASQKSAGRFFTSNLGFFHDGSAVGRFGNLDPQNNVDDQKAKAKGNSKIRTPHTHKYCLFGG